MDTPVIIKGINRLSLDNLSSLMPTKYPIKKYINPLTPITGLKIISCNRPTSKPTTPPILYPLVVL